MTKENKTTEELLNERERTHGRFSTHAWVTQGIKEIITINFAPHEYRQTSSQHTRRVIQEACDMIAHKLGRIVAGNEFESDHWADIAGYATLVVKHLEEKQGIANKINEQKNIDKIKERRASSWQLASAV